MTDTSAIDATRAERLARLRERRAPGEATLAAASLPAPSIPADTAEVPVTVAGPRDLATPTRAGGPRRRSAAAGAKVITLGASATAMFGMIAGYGIADGLTDVAAPTPDEGAAAATPPVAAAAQTIPPASPTLTPVATPEAPAPQVIVVVVDGTTGETLSTRTGPADLADLTGLTDRTDSIGELPQAVVPPAPVAPPVAVDLAVPAPPPPPRAHPAQVPTAPPAPQATSDGS